MRALLAALILVTGPQDDIARLLEQLADNSPAVRDVAATRLIESYSAWKKPLEEALACTTDPDLKERLRHVLSDGRLRDLHASFSSALSVRIREGFPGFAAAMFSKIPETRTGAFISLQQTYNVESHRTPFPGLYLTPNEIRRLLPYFQAALDPSPDFAAARREWVRVISAYDGLLEEPDWANAARALLVDPAPAVREHALQCLASKVARAQDFDDLARRWDTLEAGPRWYFIHLIGSRKLERHYPLLLRELEDADRGTVSVQIILQSRLDSLRLRALAFLRENLSKVQSVHILEPLTPEEASPILIRLLHEGNIGADEILHELGRKGSAEAADLAAAYLSHSDWKIRSAAVRCLSGIGGPRHAPALARLLREYYRLGAKDERGEFYAPPAWNLLERWESAEEIVGLLDLLPKLPSYGAGPGAALEKLKPRGAGKVLAPFLLSEDVALARRALQLMAAAGASREAREHLPEIRNLVEKLRSERGDALRDIAKLGLKELLPLLVNHLNDMDPWAGDALSLLWTSDERRAAINDKDPNVRAAALLASSGENLAILEPFLRDPDPRVRRRLAQVLSRRPDEGVGPLLLELAKDEDLLASRAAAESFFNRPWPSTEPGRLSELLRHPAREIRFRAARYVTRPFARAHPELVRALREDQDPEVRKSILAGNPVLDPDAFTKLLDTLEKEEDALKLSVALFKLEDSYSPEEAGIALHRVFERFLRPDARVVPSMSEESLHGTTMIGLSTVLDTAGYGVRSSRGTDFEPVLLRMLATDRPELQKCAARALGTLGRRGVIPRLVELLPTDAGDAAAEALGRLKAVPKAALSHADSKVRRRAILVASIAKDPELFDALFETARKAHGDEFKAAIEALFEISRPDQAARLLELMRTPYAQDRGQVLFQLRRFPFPELVEGVAEFLGDNYMVRPGAVRFLLDTGADRYAERMARAMGEYAAPVVMRFRLRSHVGPILKWLEVPGNPVMDTTAVQVAETLAVLGMKEHLPAVILKMRTLPKEERKRMLLQVARLGGRDAVLEELRGSDPEMSVAAAEALFAAGAMEYTRDIRKAAAEHAVWAVRLIAEMGDRELAEHAISETVKLKGSLDLALAVATRVGVESARRPMMDLLRREPERTVRTLEYAWGPPPWMEADRNDYWRYRTVRMLVEKLAREWDRQITFGTPQPEEFFNTIVRGSTVDSLLQATPWKAAYFIDERGRVVIDTLDRARDGWLERMGR